MSVVDINSQTRFCQELLSGTMNEATDDLCAEGGHRARLRSTQSKSEIGRLSHADEQQFLTEPRT